MEHVIIQAEQMTVDYPRTSAGFQCFVCGTRFASNEENRASTRCRIII